MKKLSILIAFTLFLSGCTSTSKLDGDGVIPGCDQIRVGVASDKSLELPCLDDSASIDFYQIKGPIVINVWGSWCEGCRKEMPYFVIYIPPKVSSQVKFNYLELMLKRIQLPQALIT